LGAALWSYALRLRPILLRNDVAWVSSSPTTLKSVAAAGPELRRARSIPSAPRPTGFEESSLFAEGVQLADTPSPDGWREMWVRSHFRAVIQKASLAAAGRPRLRSAMPTRRSTSDKPREHAWGSRRSPGPRVFAPQRRDRVQGQDGASSSAFPCRPRSVRNFSVHRACPGRRLLMTMDRRPLRTGVSPPGRIWMVLPQPSAILGRSVWARRQVLSDATLCETAGRLIKHASEPSSLGRRWARSRRPGVESWWSPVMR